MERRVLLAIFLAFIVLYTWQALFVKPVPKTVPKAPGAASSAPSGSGATPAPSTSSSASSAVAATATAPPAATPSAAAPVVSDAAERDVLVETRDVVAVFTNRGARLKSWRLKHFLDPNKQPQELIEQNLPTQPLPFTLRVANDALTATLNSALYTVSGAPSTPATSASVDLRFEYRDSAGLHAVKEFHLQPLSYLVGFRATVTEGDRPLKPAVLWGPAIGDVGEVSRYVAKAGGLLDQNGKVVRLAPADIAKQPEHDGDFRYAGVEDNYFMTVALDGGPSKVIFQPVSIPAPEGSKEPPRELVSYTIEHADPGTPIRFFVGPKDFDVLSAIDPELALAINFGMFKVIVVPLLRSLKWVNGFAGNWGWSIILLTIIINVIMLPLKHKGVVSMRKMQEIQPEVKAIQDRYSKLKATDPAKQKMNQELMALYKERGVNPASGCVPMLLPMPVLLAMWALLSTAIELRGAPFFGWIHDLSAHDPFYVTPILMGASQMWQQKLTPSAGADPAQQKMLMFMPVMFTFMFLWAPAGLAIYYGTTNLLNIAQQYFTNYWLGPTRTRQHRPPAERRVKRAGGGKTDEAAAREP
jgi:YidC/Oxa1 family membrane protein insertase